MRDQRHSNTSSLVVLGHGIVQVREGVVVCKYFQGHLTREKVVPGVLAPRLPCARISLG